jgi:hypothetical protein
MQWYKIITQVLDKAISGFVHTKSVFYFETIVPAGCISKALYLFKFDMLIKKVH